MNEQIKEFLDQINKEINRTEERIKQHRNELTERINRSYFDLSEYGLSKDAETITKLSSKVMALYEQKEAFMFIFDVTE